MRYNIIRLVRLSFAFVILSPVVMAQDGVAQRVGQALDNAGRNIRRTVENGVARREVIAVETDLLGRVYHRVHWDKMLVTAPIQFEVLVDGTTILRGSVPDDAAKKRAVDLAQSTYGVTNVIDELVLAKNVKVVQTLPVRPVRTVIVTPTNPTFVGPPVPVEPTPFKP